MASIVEFLEGVGSSAVLRHAAGGDLQEAMEQAAVDPQASAAILAGDRPVLEAITGCRVIAHRIVTPGQGDEEDEEDAPDREDEEVRAAPVAVLATT